MPVPGGRFARVRALPVLGGLLPVDRSRITADVLAGITLAAVSIPVARRPRAPMPRSTRKRSARTPT